MTATLIAQVYRIHFHRLRFVSLFLLLVFVAVPVRALAYDFMEVEVPFKFKVGDRSFRPGHYQFVVVGVGLVAVRDQQHRVVAALAARTADSESPAPVSKLVFKTWKNDRLLGEIWFANKKQMLEVVGEQLAIPVSSPAPGPLVRPNLDSLMERNSAPGYTH